MFHLGRMRRTFGYACTLSGLLGVPNAPAGEPLRIDITTPSVIVRSGKHVVLAYRYGDVPFKPYVGRWCTPQGVNILRDAPADHLHHHGLMFAVAVDGVNFWEERNAPGRQLHRAFLKLDSGLHGHADRATIVERLDWLAPPGDRPLLHERRTLTAHVGEDLGASLLTWHSRFELPAGMSTATLSGSSYFGLGMRFVASMDADGRFFNADGRTGVAATRDARATWCAYTARAEGSPVTVAVFDHPSNPCHPATWYTLDERFAYLSVTLNLAKEPLTLTGGNPLELRYGLALWDGPQNSAVVKRLYGRWVALASPRTPTEAPRVAK